LVNELQEIVKTAGGHRDSYYTSQYLQLALMAVSERFGIDAGSELLSSVK